MIRLWLFASRPRILFPKPQVFECLTNYVRILDQLYPSKEDIKVTKQLKSAGEILGIRLLDHIIFNY